MKTEKNLKRNNMTKNKYLVPKKLWKSFGKDGKKIFNSIMDITLKNQLLYSHPKMTKMQSTQWKTICWNFSCEAAWLANKVPLPKKGSKVIDINPKTGKTVKTHVRK